MYKTKTELKFVQVVLRGRNNLISQFWSPPYILSTVSSYFPYKGKTLHWWGGRHHQRKMSSSFTDYSLHSNGLEIAQHVLCMISHHFDSVLIMIGEKLFRNTGLIKIVLLLMNDAGSFPVSLNLNCACQPARSYRFATKTIFFFQPPLHK